MIISVVDKELLSASNDEKIAMANFLNRFRTGNSEDYSGQIGALEDEVRRLRKVLYEIADCSTWSQEDAFEMNRLAKEGLKHV